MLVAPLSIASDFSFGFQSVDPTFGDDNRVDLSLGQAGLIDRGNEDDPPGSDQTPFLMEYIEHEGITYYHLIVGSPGSGFAQEVYIKAGGEGYSETVTGSSSLGDGSCRDGINFTLARCSASDPLGFINDNDFTGNGSGNPNSVMMYQVMGGTGVDAAVVNDVVVPGSWSCGPLDSFCQAFLKDAELLKPRITMTVRDDAQFFETYFDLDMRNSNYGADSIAGNLTLTTTIDDPSFAEEAGAGDFDFEADINGPDSTASSTVTGGRYVFTGTQATAASLNPYDYVDGDFNLDQDWSSFFDPLQNP